RVPVLLWGAPGTGKTSVIRAMAGAMGLPCETVIASIREPSDLAGLPIVVGGEVRFAPPAWARRLAEAGRGLLFRDELSRARLAVAADLGDGGTADGRRGRGRHRRRSEIRADQGGHRRRGRGGVPRLAGGDGPARSGAGAGRPGLVPAPGAG